MSFEKMNRILEIDEANLTVTAEPGVVTAEISRAAATRGLLYAGDPCSGDASFIGGNIAENAGRQQGHQIRRDGRAGARARMRPSPTAPSHGSAASGART